MRVANPLAGPVDAGRFTFHRTPLAGVWRVVRKPIADERGAFCRFYCAEDFAAIGIDSPLAQINHSWSRQQGTVRGLHFQKPPFAEAKVVTCLRGRVVDFAVDLRQGSPTFLQWTSLELSADNRESLLIPPGCAHGFQTLVDDCELLYLHTVAYAPQAEGGVRIDEERLSPPLVLPLPISEISGRDRGYPPLSQDFEGFTL